MKRLLLVLWIVVVIALLACAAAEYGAHQTFMAILLVSLMVGAIAYAVFGERHPFTAPLILIAVYIAVFGAAQLLANRMFSGLDAMASS